MPSCFPQAAAQVGLLVRAYIDVAAKRRGQVYVVVLVRDLHPKCFGMHNGTSHGARECVCFMCNFTCC